MCETGVRFRLFFSPLHLMQAAQVTSGCTTDELFAGTLCKMKVIDFNLSRSCAIHEINLKQLIPIRNVCGTFELILVCLVNGKLHTYLVSCYSSNPVSYCVLYLGTNNNETFQICYKLICQECRPK